jgi:hypothetical protein
MKPALYVSLGIIVSGAALLSFESSEKPMLKAQYSPTRTYYEPEFLRDSNKRITVNSAEDFSGFRGLYLRVKSLFLSSVYPDNGLTDKKFPDLPSYGPTPKPYGVARAWK